MPDKLDQFFERFRIEPRSAYAKYTDRWLVVFDKHKGAYLLEPGSSKKYMTFKDSDEIYRHLKTSYNEDQ